MVTDNRRPAARAVRKDRGTIYDRVAEARARRAAAAEGHPSDPPAPQSRTPAARQEDASAARQALQKRAREALPVTSEPAANAVHPPEADGDVELVPELIAPPEQPRELLPSSEPPPTQQRGAANLPALVPADETRLPASVVARKSWRSEALQWIISVFIVAAIALGVMWNGRNATPVEPVDEVSTTTIDAPDRPQVAAVEPAPQAPTADAAPDRTTAGLQPAVPGETADTPSVGSPPEPVPEPIDLAAAETQPVDPDIETLRARLADPDGGSADPGVEALRERLAAETGTMPEDILEETAQTSEEPTLSPLPVDSDVRVILHAPRSVPGERVGLLSDALGEAGVSAEVRGVNMTITRDNVRFYHPQDREAAALVAQAMDADLRDFTDFSPSPPEGLIEVWVAGEEIGGSSSGTAAGSGTLSGLRGDLRAMARDLRRALR